MIYYSIEDPHVLDNTCSALIPFETALIQNVKLPIAEWHDSHFNIFSINIPSIKTVQDFSITQPSYDLRMCGNNSLDQITEIENLRALLETELTKQIRTQCDIENEKIELHARCTTVDSNGNNAFHVDMEDAHFKIFITLKGMSTQFYSGKYDIVFIEGLGGAPVKISHFESEKTIAPITAIEGVIWEVDIAAHAAPPKSNKEGRLFLAAEFRCKNYIAIDEPY